MTIQTQANQDIVGDEGSLHPAIRRLVERYDYPVIRAGNLEAFIADSRDTVLFFTEDVNRFPESADVAIILPELQRHFNHVFKVGVVAREDEKKLQTMFGFKTWPALVFARAGQYVATVSGILNWGEFVENIQAALHAGPTRPPSIGIAVTDGSPSNSSHCH
jgi:hydrogenase-1 operon protein HyaE